MKKIMFAIKDVKTEFLDPFISINEKFTLVDIQRALDDNKIPHYVDKELWKIGEFNSITGQLEQKDGAAQFVCSLSSLKKVEKENGEN